MICIALVLPSGICIADNLDTLSSFDRDGRYHWYRLPDATVQAARFEIRAAGELRELRIMLGGNATEGSARVRIYGFEGGGPVPFLEQDLVEPIWIGKTKPGIEWISVSVPGHIRLQQRQFFVAVDRLSPDVTLITDMREKRLPCSDGSELYGYQCVKTEEGRWWRGKYGFAIDAIVAYDKNPGERRLIDVTATVGLLDTAAVRGGIAWGDYNGDGRHDILMNGKLYENRDDTFVEVGERLGLRGNPAASFFIDVNNDTRPDILHLGNLDTASQGSSRLFVAGDDGTFRSMQLEIPPVIRPSTIGIADADLDGYLDLFVGQGADEHGVPLPDLMLINNGRHGFIDRAGELFPTPSGKGVTRGVQWSDINGDGVLDLYVVREGGSGSKTWLANGDGTFRSMTDPISQYEPRAVELFGGHWQDVSGDGRPDLAAPPSITIAAVDGDLSAIDGLASVSYSAAGSESGFDRKIDRDEAIEFSERRGSGIWVDVDNSGTLDLFLASASPCRNADLYLNLNTTSARFEARSSEFGLLHVPAGPDAVWVDYNNDGLLDLATLVNGYFRLFKNVHDEPGNYVAVELNGGGYAGLNAELYTGDRKISREIASGRGLLMQEPMRLHFGIGHASEVDSLVVIRPGGERQTFSGLTVNALNRLGPNVGGIGDGGTLSGVSFFPNPFSGDLTVRVELRRRESVIIDVVDLEGRSVARLADDQFDQGTHEIRWRAVDGEGNPLSQGTYIVKISAGSASRLGRVTLRR